MEGWAVTHEGDVAGESVIVYLAVLHAGQALLLSECPGQRWRRRTMAKAKAPEKTLSRMVAPVV